VSLRAPSHCHSAPETGEAPQVKWIGNCSPLGCQHGRRGRAASVTAQAVGRCPTGLSFRNALFLGTRQERARPCGSRRAGRAVRVAPCGSRRAGRAGGRIHPGDARSHPPAPAAEVPDSLITRRGLRLIGVSDWKEVDDPAAALGGLCAPPAAAPIGLGELLVPDQQHLPPGATALRAVESCRICGIRIPVRQFVADGGSGGTHPRLSPLRAHVHRTVDQLHCPAAAVGAVSGASTVLTKLRCRLTSRVVSF
jgi:hypothetical protein